MKFEIKHRYSGAILFEAEIGSFKACVELAVKQRADLRFANLYNANLIRANLEDANLIRANLEDANLYNANLYNANLYNANLYNANLYNANLYNANLEDANLEDANLIRANLEDANLIRANLEDANLEDANLEDCCYIPAGIGGSHKRMIMCNPEQNLVRAGCFKGTLDEFKAAVVDKYGKDYGSYKGVVAYLDAVVTTKVADTASK